jgi:hypothetical protein
MSKKQVTDILGVDSLKSMLKSRIIDNYGSVYAFSRNEHALKSFGLSKYKPATIESSLSTATTSFVIMKKLVKVFYGKTLTKKIVVVKTVTYELTDEQ